MKKIYSFCKKSYMLLFLMSMMTTAMFAQKQVTFKCYPSTNAAYRQSISSKDRTISFQIKPEPCADVVALDAVAATDVTATDPFGDALMDGVKKVTASGATGGFTVEFTNSIGTKAAQYWQTTDPTGAATFMITFKAGSLKTTDGKYVNKNDVTAFIDVYEHINVQVVTPTDGFKICEQPDCIGGKGNTISFNVTAVGGTSGSDYTSKVKINDNAGYTGQLTLKNNATSVEEKIDNSAVKVENGVVTVTLGKRTPGEYTITFPARYFKAVESYSGVDQNDPVNETVPPQTANLTVYPHHTYAVTTGTATLGNTYELANVISPANKFLVQYDVTATPAVVEPTAIKDGAVVLVAGDKKYPATANTYDVAKKLVEVTLNNDVVLPEGDYEVTFSQGTFANALCISPKVSTTISVKNVKWEYAPASLNGNDKTSKTYAFTVKASLNGEPREFTDKDLTKITIDGAAIDGTVTPSTKDGDPATADEYVITLNNPLVAGAHTIDINAGAFTSVNSDNTVGSIAIDVKKWVSYKLTQPEIDIPRHTSVVEFDMSGETADGQVNTQIVYQPEGTSVITFNTAFEKYKTPNVETSLNKDGTTHFVVTIPDEVNNGLLDQCKLAIPANTVYTTDNKNVEVFAIDINMLNYVDITADPTVYYMHTTTSGTVKTLVSAIDADDLTDLIYKLHINTDPSANTNVYISKEGVKGSIEMPLADALDLTDVSTRHNKDVYVNGAKVGTIPTYKAAAFTIKNLNLSSEGVYTVLIPKGALKANANVNDDITLTIYVEDFALADQTINTDTKKFDMSVCPHEISVLNASYVTVNGVPATLVKSETTGMISIELAAALPKGDYPVEIAIDGIAGAYAHNYEVLKATLHVINEFFFQDNDKTSGSSVSTTVATVNTKIAQDKLATDDAGTATYDKVHYVRTFTGNWESLALPFSITVTDSDPYDIYRFVTYAKGEDLDGNTVDMVVVTKVKAGQSTMANFPYFVKAKESGTKTIVFEDVVMNTPKSLYFHFGSMKGYGYITTNTEKVVVPQATEDDETYVVSGGKVAKVTTAGSSLKPWRWYMDLYNYSGMKDYAKISVDGNLVDEDGNITAVQAIPVSEINTNGAVYNVAGQKMNGTHKGVNIVNGHKIAVK